MNPDKLPKKIIRLNDGAEFLLDESTNKYELWMPGMEGWLHHQYSYENLIDENGDAFKVADGTEDIIAMKREWKKRIDTLIQENRGCGDEDYEG